MTATITYLFDAYSRSTAALVVTNFDDRQVTKIVMDEKERNVMRSYDDDISKMMREAEQILAPLHDFERLYCRSYQKVVSDMLKREHLLRRALPELSSSYRRAIESMQPAVDLIRGFERLSPPMSLLTDAHANLSFLLKSRADIESISRASVALSPHWAEHIATYERFSKQTSATELALKSHYTVVAESALLAQERMLGVQWDSLGSATTMPIQEFKTIREHFMVLSDAYGSLMISFDVMEHFMAAFPPIFSSGPPIEIFTSACILDSLSEPLIKEAYPDVEREIEANIEDEIEASVDQLLADVNPDLRVIWLGAKKALRSENPDRSRHVAFALRELVTHVLHALAPDEAIRNWANDQSCFHNGRPTRKARVLYICRGIDHEPFTKFIRADAKANIEFINLFQRGHELAVSFSEEQLETLVRRTEAFIRFLILTHRTTK